MATTVGVASGVAAVRTTGIYCRPECTARPDPSNVTTYLLPAAAEAAGYRACLRCRPYRQDAPIGDLGPELVCRAVRMVVGGALDGSTEAALAAEVGVSPRHLRRLFDENLGVTPDGLARSRRAHFARRLLDDTDLTVTDVAFASGYGSLRQLQRACAEIFRASPRELRDRRRRADRLVADGGLDVRLSHQGPLDWPALLAWLDLRAIPGVEAVDGDTYRRTIMVEGRDGDDPQPGVVELRPDVPGTIVMRAHLPRWEGLIHLADRARALASLDLDIAAANEALGADRLIGPLVQRRPGLRPVGSWDPFETAVRAVLSQQVSVAAARALATRLVAACGREVVGLAPMGLSHAFPAPAGVAALGRPDTGSTATSMGTASLGLTRSRHRSVVALARAVESGDLDLGRGSAPPRVAEGLCRIEGIGDWTAQCVALRLGEPDALPAGDVALSRALHALRTRVVSASGSDRPTAAELSDAAEVWRPWRSVAATHLWTSLSPTRA